MPLPIIGILAELERERKSFLPLGYERCVREAGGVPVIVPMQEGDRAVGRVLDPLQGLVLPGGYDINPSRYGEEAWWSGTLMPARKEDFDFRVLAAAVERRMPLLAICLGAQELNVALGGSLIQDLGTQFPGAMRHRRRRREDDHARHTVTLLAGSRLRRIIGREQIEITTSHHQAVNYPGVGLRVAAVADDGVVEAVEGDGHPFLIGVQWHPEMRPEDESTKRLFRALVRAGESFPRGR